MSWTRRQLNRNSSPVLLSSLVVKKSRRDSAHDSDVIPLPFLVNQSECLHSTSLKKICFFTQELSALSSTNTYQIGEGGSTMIHIPKTLIEIEKKRESVLFLSTITRDLELEMIEDDIEWLIMEDELTTEELQEILNEEHQETQQNVSPSGQEKDERGPMPTSVIKDLS
ncbi:hypothetical protein TNCV_3952811 [Trichonephila clavipes]|nr:hypothetical protein TNCV_3952811 [Trichonephila clavipes]